MTESKRRQAPASTLCLAALLTGCATDAVQREAGDTVPAPVLAALESAARGTPFDDDLHPDTARTGKALSPRQAAFDVRHYGLALRVMPDTRTIDGTLEVTFTALAPLSAIELDLDPRLSVHGASLDGQDLAVARDDDTVIVTLPAAVAAGQRATVSVAYGGSPHTAKAPPWAGGFVWSEVDGTPWFATAVQTEGCDLWWPCKDTYADKPDEGVRVSISAPRGVTVASIGVLEKMETGDDGYDTWHWVSRHPYTGYAVAINGGPYTLIERDYRGINGTVYPVRFWALAKNAEKAAALVDGDAVKDLEFFERMIGPYPWGDEKVGFVETPHLGMEHQTINGYGEQYKRGNYGFDWLLHHELAHEWFGNVMTHARPEDAWLHEGYGAYMQAVYAEETVGAMGYFDSLYRAYTENENCQPVVNSAAQDVGEAFDNRDIYTKGTWMLHSLRRYMGDEAFWAGTRRLVYGTAEPWSLPYPIEARFRTTDDFIRIMSEEAGEDVAWLVEAYLYEAGLPELVTERGEDSLTLHWSVPGDRAFPMPVAVSVDGVVTEHRVSAGPVTITVPDNARVIVDPDSRILRALPIIGDCEEQTDVQVQRNIDRFTRMAREYGWQRD